MEINAIRTVLFEAIDTSNKFSKSLQDGFQLQDEGLLLVQEYPDIQTIITMAPIAWAQRKNLTEENLAQLNSDIALRFDIPNDKVEEKIEEVLDTLTEGYMLIKLNIAYVKRVGRLFS